MNGLSLAHYNDKNQYKNPAWIDNPFDLKDLVTGVTIVSPMRNLQDYAQELVANYATYSSDQYELYLDMLPEESKNELARLYIESIDREIEWACYGDDESLNSSFLCALLNMLKNDCEETREHFATITRKNILIYYKDTLENLLIAACLDYQYAMNNETSYYDNQDQSAELTRECL